MGLLINFMRFLATVEEGLACGGADVLKVIKFAFMLLDIAFIAIPIGLMVMLFIDFFKNVTAGKEDEMKKNLGIIIKRIIYCVVLFLVPTVVYFIVWLLGDLANFEYINCINIAKDADSAYLESVEIDYYDFDNEDEETYKCYKCANDYIYVWSDKKPSGGSNGCSVNFEIDSTKHTKDRCYAAGELSCYGCSDGSGFVLSHRDPGYGFLYKNGNSFRTTTSVCRPGFVPTDIRYCSNEKEFVINVHFYDAEMDIVRVEKLAVVLGETYGDGRFIGEWNNNKKLKDITFVYGIDKADYDPNEPVKFWLYQESNGEKWEVISIDKKVKFEYGTELHMVWDVVEYFNIEYRCMNNIDENVVQEYSWMRGIEFQGTRSCQKMNGYTFLGWFTAEEGGVEIDGDENRVLVYSDHVLYAHWEKN